MQLPDPRIHEKASIGFERAVDAYERARPEYPMAAVECVVRALRMTAGAHVIELGAGTGKFTRLLMPVGAQITAIEPIPEMRQKLVELVPGVQVVDGTAESIPASDASIDAVVAAQAFHWFRGPEALAEIHRVLKPGGGLGLIWNVRDESVGWVRKLNDFIDPYEQAIPRYKNLSWKPAFDSTSLFSSLEKKEFQYIHRMPANGLIDRVDSISFIAALPESQREAVVAQVRGLLHTDPGLRGKDQIDFPYRTDVYWCRKL